MKCSIVSRAMRTVLLAVALTAAAGVSAAGGAGQAVVITAPEDAAVPASFPSRVAHWRQEQGMDNVLWVNSVKQDKPSGFETMAVFAFDSASARLEWSQSNHVEAPLRATPVDVLAQGGSAPAPGSAPVYKISYYSLNAPRAEFQAWVDGYLVKYLDAQLQGGILARYGMYLEHGADGRALLVLEYPDADAEQGAEPVKDRLGAEIARTDAEYVRQLALKDAVRTTRSWTLAVPAK